MGGSQMNTRLQTPGNEVLCQIDLHTTVPDICASEDCVVRENLES